MTLPAASLRWPFSIGWVIRVLTSITTLFRSVAGTRRRGLMSSAMISSSAAAAADGDLDLAARGVERAVVHLRDHDQLLRLGEPHAELDLSLAGERREFVGRNRRIGIAVGGDIDRLHVRLVAHLALDRDGDRHGVAVLRDLRRLQGDLALFRRSFRL